LGVPSLSLGITTLGHKQRGKRTISFSPRLRREVMRLSPERGPIETLHLGLSRPITSGRMIGVKRLDEEGEKKSP